MEYSGRRGMDFRRMQMFPSNNGNIGKPLHAASIKESEEDNKGGNVAYMATDTIDSEIKNDVQDDRQEHTQEYTQEKSRMQEIGNENSMNQQNQMMFSHPSGQENMGNTMGMGGCRSCRTSASLSSTFSQGSPTHHCGGMHMENGNGGFRPLEQSANFTVGMAYVPMQRWEQTYDLATARKRGTLFPSLDLPFVMGRCR